MSEYTLPKGYLSPSQINLYMACPACYELQYIHQQPSPTSIALPLGGAVHYGIEYQRRQVLAGEVPDYEDVVETGVEHFNDEVGRAESLDLGKLASTDEAKDQVARLLRFAAPRLMALDEKRGLVACELDLKDFGENNPWPFPIVGRVDALYGPGPALVNLGTDTKTAARAEYPSESISLQLGIYREFIPVGWVVDQVTKTRSPQLTTYELADDGREYVLDTVLDVARHISAGDFPVRPSFMCRYVHGSPSFSITTADYQGVA